MPQATVYEDGDAVLRQNQVRRSGKIVFMQSEAVAEAMEK